MEFKTVHVFDVSAHILTSLLVAKVGLQKAFSHGSVIVRNWFAIVGNGIVQSIVQVDIGFFLHLRLTEKVVGGDVEEGGDFV